MSDVASLRNRAKSHIFKSHKKLVYHFVQSEFW